MPKKSQQKQTNTNAANEIALRSRTTVLLTVAFLVGIPAAYFGAPGIFSAVYEVQPAKGEAAQQAAQVAATTSEKFEREVEREVVSHLETPVPVKAIYMSQCVVGTPSFRDDLVKLVEETELNAIMIDVKDFSGTIGFPTKDPRFEQASMRSCGARDMKAFLKLLHDKGIYTIARITVFQDPLYTSLFPEEAVQSVSRPGVPWTDHKGLAFVDVASTNFWDYIIALSEEAYAIGFDELNYDYIRYPSDGNMQDASYVNPHKAEAVEAFWKHLDDNRPEGSVISADIFGYTTVFTDDLGIGQQLERALPYFDYVAPMVYPSHYNAGFAGLANPNSDPYKVVYESMIAAVRRTVATSTAVAWSGGTPIASTSPRRYTKPAYDSKKLRPWLQDFDYGGDYDAAEVRAQIQATYDAGLDSWMLWAPSNRYTRGALNAAGTSTGATVSE